MNWTIEDDVKMFDKWFHFYMADRILVDNYEEMHDIAYAAWNARGIDLEKTIRNFIEVDK